MTTAERYLERTRRSALAYARASQRLAGGVAADIKGMSPHPLYIVAGHGSHVTDVDGSTYIDMRPGSGSLILGHAPTAVTEAVRRQLDAGLVLTLPTELESELAERIHRHMPHVERLRFVNSGSEATIMAIRAARAFTGRDLVAKFEGGFHGHANDNLLVRQGPGGVVPAAAGIPRHSVENVLLLPFNDVDRTVRLVREHADSLAAVITEPVPLTYVDGREADPAFLHALREITETVGVPLVFDENVTAFRLGLGGATRYFGVTPDLVAMGKIVGGGMPVGAFGGREDIMESAVVKRAGASIRQSGTHSAHPLTMAAGIATLDALEREDVYPALANRGEQLRTGIAAACAAAGVEALVLGIESICNVRFLGEPHEKVDRSVGDPVRHEEFCLGLIAEGVYLPPGYGCLLTAAHSEHDIRLVVDAAGRVLDRMSAGTAKGRRS